MLSAVHEDHTDNLRDRIRIKLHKKSTIIRFRSYRYRFMLLSVKIRVYFVSSSYKFNYEIYILLCCVSFHKLWKISSKKEWNLLHCTWWGFLPIIRVSVTNVLQFRFTKRSFSFFPKWIRKITTEEFESCSYHDFLLINYINHFLRLSRSFLYFCLSLYFWLFLIVISMSFLFLFKNVKTESVFIPKKPWRSSSNNGNYRRLSSDK